MNIARHWGSSRFVAQRQGGQWRSWWPPILCIIVFWSSLGVLFFGVFKYHQPPWYYTSDQDAILGPQIVLLLNDGDFTHLHHPEATTIAAQAMVHRVMAFFGDADARAVLHLLEVRSWQDVARLLSHVVRIGRVLALLNTLALTGIFYLIILRLTRKWPVAFVFTAVLAGSDAILNHLNFAAIRAETQSVAIFLVAALLCYVVLSRRDFPFPGLTLGFVSAGVCFGMAVWAKVQILPHIAILLLAVSVWIAVGRTNVEQAVRDRKATTINLAMSIFSLLLCPWWALIRPRFLTPEFVSRITYSSDRQLYGGDIPDSFIPPLAAVLLSMVALSLILALAHSRMAETWRSRLTTMSLFGNSLVLGGFVSAYLVTLPLSVTSSGYFTNLHHLVYVTLKNISHGSLARAVNTPIVPLELWRPVDALLNIWRLHDNSVSPRAINLLFLVGVVSLLCILRVAFGSPRGGISYLMPLSLFATALMADIVSSTRIAYYVMSYYAVYSVPFYVLGLAVFTHLETEGLGPGCSLRQAPKMAPRMVGLLFVGFIVAQYAYCAIVTPTRYERPTGNDQKTGRRLQAAIVPQFSAAIDYAFQQASDVAAVEKQAAGGGARWWSPRQDSRQGEMATQPEPPGYRVTLERGEGQIQWILSQQDIPDPGVYGVDKATVSLWLKVASRYSQDEIVLFGDRNFDFGISITPAGYGFLEPHAYFGGAGSRIDSDKRIQMDEWHQIALVKEPELLHLYVDGVEAGSRRIEARPVISGPFALSVRSSEPGSGNQVLSVSQATTWGTALAREEVERLFRVQRTTYVDTAFSDLRAILEEQGLSRR